ncbi:hypothetical protein GCM10007424_12890 [Flavobacterium suaedae]|uniref:DUF4199 domain-containing protein n=1 Tax=Flavobacterium suaedae TaxID=1767027 RepID=A0ABQ1JTS6_9FLAO|nr:DUF4199 domain-containing protein [Flavobacterium suaedae]GGB74404.1 hypothetical protein GCM10007424_12890 [Flavobacterium suaedae]
MEKTTSPGKASLQYALIFGVLMILELVIGYSLDLNAQADPVAGIVMNLLNFLILPVTFISLACNHYKKINGGYISFGQSIKCGVSVTALAALIFSVLNALFYVILPEAKEKVLLQQKEALAQQPGMTSETLKQAVSGIEFFMQPYITIPFTIIMFTFVGLIISLIVGAIVKKDNPGAF